MIQDKLKQLFHVSGALDYALEFMEAMQKSVINELEKTSGDEITVNEMKEVREFQLKLHALATVRIHRSEERRVGKECRL